MQKIRIKELNASIEWLSGQCPVQAEGDIGGKKFYFRARWNKWSVAIGDNPVGKPEFIYSESWGNTPGEAGYMTEDESIVAIIRGLDAYKTTTAKEEYDAMWDDTVRRNAFRYAEQVQRDEPDRLDKIVDKTVSMTLEASAKMVVRHMTDVDEEDQFMRGFNMALRDIYRELQSSSEVCRVREGVA